MIIRSLTILFINIYRYFSENYSPKALKKESFLLFVSLIFSISSYSQQVEFLIIKPSAGDGISSLLNHYHILDSCNKANFLALNKIKKKAGLNLDKQYQLPIEVYDFNGTSIRTTIGIKDFKAAKRIEIYNDSLYKLGVKKKDFRENKKLWVPYHLSHCKNKDSVIIKIKPPTTAAVILKNTISYPIFGKEHEEVEIENETLKGTVYYIVSGHGGPDPGSIGSFKNSSICEDEYAYDIALRLARNLISKGATVYTIIQDSNDGIRSEEILPCDNDEKTLEDKTLPLSQLKRLKQRVNLVNKLCRKHRKTGNYEQKLIILHVDSRKVNKRIDMFFYHDKKSKSGKKLSNHLLSTIEGKYNQYQKNRGYSGYVRIRNLYVLSKTLPTSVYIELGNIQNKKDQKRLVLESNRQAIANWLGEGLTTYEKK